MLDPNARSGNRALLLGVGTVAVLAGLYPLVADRAQDPLSVFLLAPLVTAVLSDGVRTAVVGTLATAVAAVEGTVGTMDPAPLVVRLGIIALGTALAAVAADARRRREGELASAQVRSALSESFQSGLMPSPRPPSWLSAATRYQPGTRGLMLGGDFVDVITLPDGAAAFVIGDVSGHGPRAAAFGTAIRAAWKGIAYTVPDDPIRWMDEVETAYFSDARFDGYVTALTGRMEADGTMRLVSAGHRWPVLVDRSVEVMPVCPSLPLGTGLSGTRRANECRLAPGASLLMYTDGLIENRLGPRGISDERDLIEVVASQHGAVDLDALLGVYGPTGFEDDVALLLLTHVPGGTR